MSLLWSDSMFKVGIITSSDKGFKGEKEPIYQGLLLQELVEKKGYKVIKQTIVPDEIKDLTKEMIHMADELKVDLILTTGVQGLIKRYNLRPL